MGGDLMKRTDGEQLYGSTMERTVDSENSTNLTNEKIWIRNNTGRKLDESLVTKTGNQNNSSDRTNVTKKNDGSEVSKTGRNNGIFLRMEQRKAEGKLNGSETDIIEKEVNRQSTSQRHVRFQDDTRKTEKLGSRAIEMQGRSTKSDTQLDKIDRWESDIEDRAAFRTFEVFTDVRNRPRVLRAELEERIQKLAKLLNATDVNMPEWQFSKMIHGAKIKFTEHSILRIVQILGALGNWKRALQVVQWLQSRERFKSYKSRF